MICDAHVHVGYWRANGELRYYSPRRVIGVLNRCGVDRFIVSSTSPQAGAIAERDLIREAEEIIRLSGERAHVYCWITGAMYDADPELRILNSGVYEGIKLHEHETPWNTARRDDFKRIIEIAKTKHLNIMLHCGPSAGCSPMELAWAAKENPDIRFNFAHCRPRDEMISVMKLYPNVYTDISCLPADSVKAICSENDVTNRIMFGSDFPSVFTHNGLTYAYREYLSGIFEAIKTARFNRAFQSFVSG